MTTDVPSTPPITIDDPPPLVQNCTATLNLDETITLNWDQIPGESSYQVRRNGAWLETTGALTYSDQFAIQGDTYVVRSHKASITTTTNCE